MWHRGRSPALAACAWILALAPAVAQLPAPSELGVIELAGDWRVRGDSGSGDVFVEGIVEVGATPVWAQPRIDDRGWVPAALPTDYGALQAAAAGARDLWLRRHVRLPLGASAGPLGLLVGPPPLGRLEVWIGGREVGVYDASEIVAQRHGLPRVLAVPADAFDAGGAAVVALRFRPASWASPRRLAGMGAIGEGLAIGPRAILEQRAEALAGQGLERSAWLLALASALLALGLYHLLVFTFRRDDHDARRFGVLTCILAVATVLASAWPYRLGLSPASVRHLTAAVQHTALAAGMIFLWPFLGRALGTWQRRYAASHLAIAILALVPGVLSLPGIEVLRWAWMLPALLAGALLVAEETWRGGRSVRVVGAAVLAVVAVVLAEVLLQTLLGSTIAPAGTIVAGAFAFAIGGVIASRSSRAHAELDDLRQRLERMVVDRTDELTAANRRLENEIGERKLAEDAMRMLERAVEQSRDGIVVLDPSGQIQFTNQSWARMHGYEVHETLGNNFGLFFTPEQMHATVVPLVRRVEESGAQEGEVDHRHHDGSTFPSWLSITQLRDAARQPAGFVAIARDLTNRRRETEERRELEARVQHARRLESLASLAGGIAHDYNNLLTAVLSNASLALRELPPGAPGHDKLRQIERAAEQAGELSHQLLAYAGEHQAAPQRQQLNDLVGHVREQLETIIGSRATLDLQLRPDLPAIEMDAGQVGSMIAHLTANAVESLGTERGFITVRTSCMSADRAYLSDAIPDSGLETGEYVFLEVSDSGIGMDDETLARIFEPKFTTKASASGLGLSAVMGIVRSHGGAIKVFSQAGRGTTVQVLFPPAPPPRPKAPVAQPADDWRGTGTVLVVDDQAFVVEVCEAILGPLGFTVLTASSGPEAIALYRDHRSEIRLVLLDWTMPDMNGEEVYRELRALEPRARVVLMSGYEERQVMDDLGGLGLAGFLHKPFKPEEMIVKVRAALG